MRPAGDALLDTVARAIEGTDTSPAALRAGMHAFFAFIDADRDAWRVLFDATLPAGGEVARGVLEYRARLDELVRALLAQTAASTAPASTASASARSSAGRSSGTRATAT